VLGASVITTTAASRDRFYPAVAFDGTNYLVVWSDNRSGAGDDIFGARVSSAGEVLDGAGIAISTAGGHQFDPAVAFDGSNYLVVWEDRRSGANSDIFAARMSPAGVVVDPTLPVTGGGIAISTAANDQLDPAVVWNGSGSRYLVVWEDRRLGVSDIYGARVSNLGTLEDPAGIVISGAPNEQTSPWVAVNGSFLVAWRDRRSGSYQHEYYGTRVNNAGRVEDAAGVFLAKAENSEDNPAVAQGPPGALRFGVVYQRFAAEAPYGADRVFFRTFSK
jgi:hypothetical protein